MTNSKHPEESSSEARESTSTEQPKIVLWGDAAIEHVARIVVRKTWAWVLPVAGVVVLAAFVTDLWIQKSVREALAQERSSLNRLSIQLNTLEERSAFRSKLEDFSNAGINCSEADLARILELDAKPYLRDSPALLSTYTDFVGACQSVYAVDGKAIEAASLLDRFDSLLRTRAQRSQYVNNNMLEHYVLRILLSNVPGDTAEGEWEKLESYAASTRRFFGPPLALASQIVAATKQGKQLAGYLVALRRHTGTCIEVRQYLRMPDSLTQATPQVLGEEGQQIFDMAMRSVEELCPEAR